MPSGPKLMNSGQAAMAAVAKVLPTAHSITLNSSLGAVELKPGTIWSGNKLLFYAAPMYVWYAIDDRIYESGTGDFIRDEWLNALSAGARRAAHWVTIAKVEFALLSGIFVPWYVLLGMSCAKAGLFYSANKTAVNLAMDQAPRVITLLQDVKRRSPALFNKLLTTAARDILMNIPSGVTAESVAFFLGRLMKGVAGAGPELTVGALARIVGTAAALVAVTHVPVMVAHGTGHAAGAKAAELKRRLQAAGYTVTDAEAKTIFQELMRNPDSPQKLKALEEACKALVPTLDVLRKAYLAT